MPVGQRFPTHVSHRLITKILLPSGHLAGFSAVSCVFASAFRQLPTEQASATLAWKRTLAASPLLTGLQLLHHPSLMFLNISQTVAWPGPAAAPVARAGSAVKSVWPPVIRLPAPNIPRLPQPLLMSIPLFPLKKPFAAT